MNERRKAVFDQLKKLAPDLNIIFKSNVWGILRNELIARSKIILNIHYYLTGILETPRISHAVANHKFIISETSNPDDEARIDYEQLKLNLAKLNKNKYVEEKTAFVKSILEKI
ncbi:hypothetical protein KOY_00220 [Bacillus cereus VDM021]|nr:hypothetical protein KOY_00220 [Bacillus cereus VDM021]